MELILPFLLIFAAFYLLILGPRRAQARRAADLEKNLRPGVELITTAGVFGTVTRIDEEEVRLEIAPGVEIRLLKGAIGKILDPDAGADGSASTALPGEKTDESGSGSGPSSSH
ncbi:hypothetical protein GCM10009547_31330 [Sporichthya brevicatena]|uniref:Preprotein translocase subunit YajC n=1 Tax=Sporichthya brevicatena TaxID=171442 RepID=A0ABN1H0T3_9ACTN